METTARGRAKAQRRSQILDSAAQLFARYGYAHVPLDAIGEKAGISGPGVYRHFGSKQDILKEMLNGVSTFLVDGARVIRASADTPLDALFRLIEFHVDFAVANKDVIRVHDRDFGSLDKPHRSAVRDAQKTYVSEWQDVLRQVHPDLDEEELQTRAFGVIGLINSTAYSRPRTGTTTRHIEDVLTQMARSAVDAPDPSPSRQKEVAS